MSAFSVEAISVGFVSILLGCVLVIWRRQASERLQRRAERAAVTPSFMSSATYLQFVGVFGMALGVGSLIIGLASHAS